MDRKDGIAHVASRHLPSGLLPQIIRCPPKPKFLGDGEFV
jgi:hypothetical protein